MRRLITLLLGVTAILLATIPTPALAQNEPADWRTAKFKNDARAYDLYLAQHPDGPNAAKAHQRAVKVSAQYLASAARGCDPGFAVMAYYAFASPAGQKVQSIKMDLILSQATICSFQSYLDPFERRRAVDGLLAVREELLTNTGRLNVDRGVIAAGFILVEIERAVLEQGTEQLYKCKQGTNAFVDPSPKEVQACLRFAQSTQALVAEAIANQMKADFVTIANVGDKNYRREFWDFYHRQAKADVIQKVAAHYRIHDLLIQARAAETEPAIIKKIDRITVLLAGPGKPRDAAFR